MSDCDSVQYLSIPKCQSWIIPFWDRQDRDEFEDLTNSIRRGGPERFDDAIKQFNKALTRTDDVVGVRFYIGTSLTKRTTLVLSLDTRKQTIDILDKTTKMMADERGVVPWSQIRVQLSALRDAVSTNDEELCLSFGFGAIIPSRRGYTEASTSWIAEK
jgi:hypothetical protein